MSNTLKQASINITGYFFQNHSETFQIYETALPPADLDDTGCFEKAI